MGGIKERDFPIETNTFHSVILQSELVFKGEFLYPMSPNVTRLKASTLRAVIRSPLGTDCFEKHLRRS